MYNPKLMQVFDAADNLFKRFACFILVHPLFVDNIVEQLSFFHVVNDQKQVLRCLNNLVQLDDIWVSDKFQNMYLPGHSLHVSYVNDSILFQDFNGHFLSGRHVGSKLDLAESALS